MFIMHWFFSLEGCLVRKISGKIFCVYLFCSSSGLFGGCGIPCLGDNDFLGFSNPTSNKFERYKRDGTLLLNSLR